MSIPQRKTGVEKDELGLTCENVKLFEREYYSTNAFMLEQAMGNRFIVMAHLMLLALIVKVSICKSN